MAAGHPAVLIYKSQGDKAPELVELEVRDDGPTTLAHTIPKHRSAIQLRGQEDSPHYCFEPGNSSTCISPLRPK